MVPANDGYFPEISQYFTITGNNRLRNGSHARPDIDFRRVQGTAGIVDEFGKTQGLVLVHLQNAAEARINWYAGLEHGRIDNHAADGAEGDFPLRDE